MININFKWAVIVTVLISIAIFIGCVASEASAQDGVDDTSSFIGYAGCGNWYAYVTGWDEYNIDLTNHWGYSNEVTYEDVGDGEIFVRVTDRTHANQWMYYEWGTIPINGNGIYVPPYGGGGRYVNVTGSPNVTGEIECIVGMERAVFQFDTRHREADLTVLVHNGDVIENATVSLINGNPIVVWTDELGEAKFAPGTGTYHLVIEHENFSSMLVDDLFFSSENSYHISINMTKCLSSSGNPICGADAESLVIYYKKKPPAMNAISPQGYVDYFADQLRTCKGGENNRADGTLQYMSDDWGVYPSALNVLLYSCTFTNNGCTNGMTELEIEYTVKNYQQYECSYNVSLIYGDESIELGSGVLPKTWSAHSKNTATEYVMIDGCRPTSTVYLVVESERADN